MQSFNQVASKLALIAVSAVFFAGCSDFLNSDKSKQETGAAGGSVEGPKRPDVNPLPPGFEEPNQAPFTEEKMLVNIGINVIAPAAADLALETSVLEKRIARACQSVGSVNSGVPANSSELTPEWIEAQAQWKRAMLAFHRVDSFPVGPLWHDDKKLSTRIYSWPLFNSCGIDNETVRVKDGIGTIASDLPNPVRGLGALEYLLFESSLTTKCNARAYPQVVKWTTRSRTEKRSDRCALASRLAADLSEQAKILSDEWDPKGRNYTRRFIDKSDAKYPNTQAAANAVTDSLFQIEALKDLRLARPLGIHKDCVSAMGKCPEDSEHPYSDFALESASARLAGFGDALRGKFTSAQGATNGFGFDDLLIARGHAEIATKIGGLVDTSLQGFKKFATSVGSGTGSGSPSGARTFASEIEAMSKEDCLASTSGNRQVEICALFQDVRAVSTSLKAELLAVLALRSPPTYQGDND
ncbi:MAG: imelysin family protein [Bdellovibrionales bacterium]|nr:imelysin family protein [Bdellovibrionales bacterium]